MSNSRSDFDDPRAEVEITVAGKKMKARAGETIIHALWAAGHAKDVQVGCAGGVCGACTVTLRFPDDRKGGTDLACMRPVEEGMEVFPFPVDPMAPKPPGSESTVEQLRTAYPTLDRCTKCESCTIACPMSIPVMDSVLRMPKGEFEAVAEDFTTCIHCGLCRIVCEDKVKPHNMGMWVRRTMATNRGYPELEDKAVSDESAQREWDYLLSGEFDERLRKAKAFRLKGGVE